MDLLEVIQESAVDPHADLSTVLRQCRLLAARLDSRPLADWVTWESDGYPSEALVPSYRVWPIEVRATFSGPIGRFAEDYPVPSALLPDDVRDQYEHYECRMSVAALEATVAQTKGTVQVSTANLCLALGDKVLAGYNCVSAYGTFSALSLVEALNAVRNRVLEFSLAIEREAPGAGQPGMPDPQGISSETVTNIFSTTMYGGAASFVGLAARSSFILAVVPGDWRTLEQALSDKGINANDLKALHRALDHDPQPADSESLGPKVSTWIANMMKKAASGAWDVGITVASRVVTEAVLTCYNLH